MVGVGAHSKRASQILSRFIDETGIALVQHPGGQGRVDERHPLFLGNAALSAHDYLHCAVERTARSSP